MKVYAWIKHKAHPQPDGPGGQRGDLSYFYPIVADQGSETLNVFFPIVVDIKIPCNFELVNGVKQWDCNHCDFNDPDDCDIRRFKRAVWTAGDVLNPPKILKKHRFNIDIAANFNTAMRNKLFNTSKTEQEKAEIITFANAHPIAVDKLLDKVVA